MTLPEPTADEYRAAYKASGLRWIGVSLQKALATPNLRTCLRLGAISKRKLQQGEPCLQH